MKTGPGDIRIQEALASLREKSPRSTTLQRALLTCEGWELCNETAQPLRLAFILRHVLTRIDIPVTPHDLLVGRMPERVPDAAEEEAFQAALEGMGGALPSDFTDNGHETFDWETLLQQGLVGLRQRIASGLDRAAQERTSASRVTFLQGMGGVVESIETYVERSADAAEAAGLRDAAMCLRAIVAGPPRTFRQALQLTWTVGLVTCSFVSRNPTLTFGRLDQWLYPFYERDLASGRLTRHEAGDLIEDFYCKNNLILGRGEHQMSGPQGVCTGWERNLTYDAPQYVVLGGERRPGRPDCTDLTDLFLERIVPRFENPYVVLRYWPGIPARTWEAACGKLRDNASMMVYNDAAVIPAFEHLGFSREEAVEYTMHGCNWPDLPPSQVLGRCMWHCLPQTLLAVLVSGPPCHSMNDLLGAFRLAYRERIRDDCRQFREFLRRNREHAPGPLAVDDLFLRGPVERACGKRHGGVDHVTMITTFGSFATLADSLAAVEQVVFNQGVVDLGGLTAALAGNFHDQEPLRQRLLRAPKMADGSGLTDTLGRRLMEIMHEEIDQATQAPGEEPILVCRSLETDTTHIRCGRQTGATPDGRRAGEPLSENSSPSGLRRSAGVTAILHSLSALPLDRCHSGALNLRLNPELVCGRRGGRMLRNLLTTYFSAGGLQAQLSMVSTETLQHAREHPDQHRDLMVRITGYSAAFTDMSDDAQREIIRREEAATN